jgi:hypothetical protein
MKLFLCYLYRLGNDILVAHDFRKLNLYDVKILTIEFIIWNTIFIMMMMMMMMMMKWLIIRFLLIDFPFLSSWVGFLQVRLLLFFVIKKTIIRIYMCIEKKKGSRMTLKVTCKNRISVLWCYGHFCVQNNFLSFFTLSLSLSLSLFLFISFTFYYCCCCYLFGHVEAI